MFLDLEFQDFQRLRRGQERLNIDVRIDRARTSGAQRSIDQHNSDTLFRTQSTIESQSSLAAATIPGFPCYRTAEETIASAAAIASANPSLVTWTDVGDSWDKVNSSSGYDMMVLKLTNSIVAGPKPKIFMTSAIHAREYTTAELTTRFAEFLVANYGIDADVTWVLDYH